jgi:hypothetical protein
LIDEVWPRSGCLRRRSFAARRYLVGLVSALLSASACRTPPDDQRVQTVYDKQTGKLSELTIDALKDGRPNVASYMDGGRIIRIEIDNDEDEKIDRWEYYGDDQKILKVGLSRANNGKPDAWVYQAQDGTVARIEVSTKRNGEANRTEFYDKGVLARVEEDADGDGRVDRWETYEKGVLASVSFDTTKTGKPNYTINYGRERLSSP